MNRLYLILIFLFVVKIQAQDNRYQIKGIITSDSVSVENIHIINKTSKKGTVSNQFGEFKILAKVNDTLVFSGVQFYTKELKITKKQIESKLISIDLFQKINTLDEVEIKAHDLTGNLFADSKNAKDSIKELNSELSKPGTWSVDFSIIDDMDETDKKRPPDASQLTNPNIPIGGNILGLASFILKPITKEISKIGKTKRELKIKEVNYQIKSKEAPEKIRSDFGDDFFIIQLNISIEKIDAFIKHCISKGIIDLYIKDKKLEIMDLLIKESENFN